MIRRDEPLLRATRRAILLARILRSALNFAGR
jgi:hypothetical protein